jgi:hypothetical protein
VVVNSLDLGIMVKKRYRIRMGYIHLMGSFVCRCAIIIPIIDGKEDLYHVEAIAQW